MAVALQLKRYGLAARLFERQRVGGLLWNANLVENYPGFPAGIGGPRLVRLFEEQISRLGIEVTLEEVECLDFEGEHFLARTKHSLCRAPITVIASGTQPRMLEGLSIPPGVDDRIGYEVYPFLGCEGRRFVIIGAGDAAFDYALNLGKKNQVVILNRGEALDCLPLLWERAKSSANIAYLANTTVERIIPSSHEGLVVECYSPKGSLCLFSDYLLVAIGRTPRVDFISQSLLKRAVQLEAQGVLYWVGDVKNGIFRQAAIAVGDGIMAAMKIYQHLKEARR